MAAARDLKGRDNVIAVIGDGSMSAGMAYEAMNNAGAMFENLQLPAPFAGPVRKEMLDGEKILRSFT